METQLKKLMEREIISSERVYDGHFKMDRHTVKDESGRLFKEECFERGNSVSAMVFDINKNVFVFTQQWRIGAKDKKIPIMTELVAGSMDIANETPIEAIKREITEELGYIVKDDSKIQFISTIYLSPGGTSEKMHIFFVEVSEKISDGGGKQEEGEDIIITEISPEGLEKFHSDDAKTAIGVLWTKLEFFRATS